VSPLPFRQLTQLRLRRVPPNSNYVLPMIAELSHLEILEVHHSHRASFNSQTSVEMPPQLTKFCELRLVKLSGWLFRRCVSPSRLVDHKEHSSLHPAWVLHLMSQLQEVLPRVGFEGRSAVD
jgi:hypothetical protein